MGWKLVFRQILYLLWQSEDVFSDFGCGVPSGRRGTVPSRRFLILGDGAPIEHAT